MGISGAGKTTMGRALSGRLELPFYEMDALHFIGPEWATNPDLRRQVTEIAATPGWIFDSLGYPEVRDVLWTHADTVVWLDYSKSVIMPRILRRSLRRTLRRERIFGGNVETLSDWLRKDHPARWAWTEHGARRTEIGRRVHDPRFAPLDVVRLTSPQEADDWLRAM
ncbi:shikimate kinase [Sphaerisporangium sp. TRM90804]|nr:shikimate kinase [Sphaerisporangium sp. TRM90804]MDH2428141.1 shikimate kinase [Sphaerisporangium sp. TRM90804]